MATFENAFGIVPLRRTEMGWEVLLVHHQKGHWAFPKGHPCGNETPLETASRELKEETNLEVTTLLSQETLQEHYTFLRGAEHVSKSNTYFLAEVTGEVQLQKEEIAEARWLATSVAQEVATFEEAKNLCKEVEKRLGGYKL